MQEKQRSVKFITLFFVCGGVCFVLVGLFIFLCLFVVLFWVFVFAFFSIWVRRAITCMGDMYFIQKDVTFPFCPCSPGDNSCTRFTNLLTPSVEEVVRLKCNSYRFYWVSCGIFTVDTMRKYFTPDTVFYKGKKFPLKCYSVSCGYIISGRDYLSASAGVGCSAIF